MLVLWMLCHQSDSSETNPCQSAINGFTMCRQKYLRLTTMIENRERPSGLVLANSTLPRLKRSVDSEDSEENDCQNWIDEANLCERNYARLVAAIRNHHGTAVGYRVHV